MLHFQTESFLPRRLIVLKRNNLRNKIASLVFWNCIGIERATLQQLQTRELVLTTPGYLIQDSLFAEYT